MTGSGKTGTEVLTSVVGALVLLFAVEAGSWYVAHQFAWWTFVLIMGGGMFGWQLLKSGWKELRAVRRRRRADRLIVERLMAAGRLAANRRQS
jgi:hypothetical protein